MGHVTSGRRGAGRHAGPARLEDHPQGDRPGLGRLLLLALGITSAVVGWGYLVYLAIDFGTAARDGDARGWLYLAMATLGGIACLFIALTLWARFAAGVRAATASPAPPRPPGGRRAAR
jgi:hypothetical protein